MKVRLKTLLLVPLFTGVLVAGLWRPLTEVPVVQPAPPPPVETSTQVRDAATAGLALILLSTAPGCDVYADASCGVDKSYGLSVARIARGFLLHRPAGFRDDCSGYVSAVFSQSGVPMDGVVSSLWDRAVDLDALHWADLPVVGDLVFFDNTNDRNNNGVWDDQLTHVGVVIDIEPDGTVVFAHSGTSRGRAVGRLNLLDPSNPDSNSWLREPMPWDPTHGAYLSGELWVAFATVDPKDDWL